MAETLLQNVRFEAAWVIIWTLLRFSASSPKATDTVPQTYSKYLFLLLQIFKDDTFSHFLDGSDEENSSWMRFIRCARHIEEQNLYAFQYCGNIFYRAFKEIPPGKELLVWYDDRYPQHHGIPLVMQDYEFRESAGAGKSFMSTKVNYQDS